MKIESPSKDVNSSIVKARVLYADTDKMGIVYHANYFRWFEAARGSYMRRRGRPYTHTEADGIQLPLIEAGITYIKPAKYEQILDVRTWLVDIRSVQLTFAYEITCNGDVLVRGFTRHVAINPGGFPTRIPDDISLILQSVENTPDEPF